MAEELREAVQGDAQEHDPLSSLSALKTVFKHSSPYALSRFAMAFTTVGNVLIIAKFDDKDAMAASPIISAFQFVMLGIGRGMLLSTGILGGEYQGKNQKSKFTSLMTKSFMLALAVFVLELPFCLLSKELLISTNLTNAKVAKYVSDYLTVFAAGLVPYFFLLADNQFLLSAKESTVTLYSGLAFSVCTMVIGYPLATVVGMKFWGLGIGFALSSLLNFIALRFYL